MALTARQRVPVVVVVLVVGVIVVQPGIAVAAAVVPAMYAAPAVG